MSLRQHSSRAKIKVLLLQEGRQAKAGCDGCDGLSQVVVLLLLAIKWCSYWMSLRSLSSVFPFSKWNLSWCILLVSLWISYCPGNLLSLFCMHGVPHFISGSRKEVRLLQSGKILLLFQGGVCFSANPKHANTGPSVGFLWELLQRVRDGSVSRRSSRLPLCVTLWCVITSRIIGSVGGNTKRGYWGRSDSEEKQRSQEQWWYRYSRVLMTLLDQRSHIYGSWNMHQNYNSSMIWWYYWF